MFVRRRSEAIRLLNRIYDSLSGEYRKYRPRYPAALFSHLASLCHEREVAWDCATGNGQAAVGLAGHFAFVWATDAAQKQIQKAKRHKRVAYSQSDCKESGLPPMSVDLVCVAQALHWFGDSEPFYREVERVLRPGGVFVATCFFLPRVDGTIDKLVEELYRSEAIRRFWYPGFRHIEERYRSLPLPFGDPGQAVSFQMEEKWTRAQFQGYLRTWPHVSMALEKGKAAAVRQTLGAIKKAWGDVPARPVTWEVSAHVVTKPTESGATPDPAGVKALREV
jgi:ubiquinone/menaquinone biosynthesis C-methylase UbiE